VLVSPFSANLETLRGAHAHPKTAEWWEKQPGAGGVSQVSRAISSRGHAGLSAIRRSSGKPAGAIGDSTMLPINEVLYSYFDGSE